MRKLLLLFFVSQISFAQTNVQNQLEVQNTSLYLAHRKSSTITDGKDFFKPYLAYYNNGTYDDALMDSFVFSDFGMGDRGVFNDELQDFYLDNVFKRTKIPVRRGAGGSLDYAVIDTTHTSALTYIVLRNGESSIELSADIGVITEQQANNIGGDIIFGIEYFDANGIEIKNFQDHEFLNYLDMHIERQELNESNDAVVTVQETFNMPTATHSYKIHIVMWNLRNKTEISIDNVSLEAITNNPFPTQLMPNDDRFFTFNDLSTGWEYNLSLKYGQYLFENRDPLIDQLNDANNEISKASLNLPNTQLILMIPELDKDNYTTPSEKDQLIIDLENYIDTIEARLAAWQPPPKKSKKVEILGLYYFGEAIHDLTLGNNGRIAFIHEILSPIRDKLHSKGWKLFGSPYHLFRCDGGACSFDDPSIIKLFDVMWQQPNSFDTSHWGELDGNTDRELLKRASKFMTSQELNVNVENRVLAEGEPYGRINDYFDYGDKYGFTNYSKMYYDDAGAHYYNANSEESDERIDYDNLYKYILKSRKGEIINNRFEILEDDDPTLLYHWDGTYGVFSHYLSSSTTRDLIFDTTTSNNMYSDKIPIDNPTTYKMTFQAKEIWDDSTTNSALVGVRFFNNNGTQITGLTTSDLTLSTYWTDTYFKYFNTSDSGFGNYSIYFIPPTDAVTFQFFLRKWHTSDIQWKSIKFFKDMEDDKSRVIYKNVVSTDLKVEDEAIRGNSSIKLDLNEYAITKDTISVSSGVNYTVKISSKEELPLIDNRYNKALIGIKAFDTSGDPLGSSTSIGDFIYSTAIGMHFRYLDVSQTWKEFSKTFQFANDIASIQIYLRNWGYNNTVYLDNLKFELDNETDLIRTLNSDNLLERDNWNEKLPLTVASNKTAFYNDFIDVGQISELDFSALIRGSGSYPADKDLLAVEFYDSSYNILLKDDITTNTNLIYSDNFEYWWKNYITIEFDECDGFPPPNPDDMIMDDSWFDNQWETYNTTIVVPQEAKYLKLYFQKVTLDKEYVILNPQLTESLSGLKNEEKINSMTTNVENDNAITNSWFSLYPNPTNSSITLKFKEERPKQVNYSIYEINGRLVEDGILKDNFNIDVSKFTNGMYFLMIRDENNYTSNHRFLKN